MDGVFFLKFLTPDDIIKLSKMPEQAISDLESIFKTAPGIGKTTGLTFGDMRALLHYHRGCTHVFIREIDIASGEFQGCVVDKSGRPELCGSNFKELLRLGFHFDFDWDAETSFGAAMFYDVPDSDEQIELPEWFSYASADYWRGMATLRDALGKSANTIYLNWTGGGFSRGWEEMEEDDDIPTYMPDDLMARDSWNFVLEIQRSDNLIYELAVFPHGEDLVLSIHSRIENPDPQASGRREFNQFYALHRKDFVDPSALSRHLPGILARIKVILENED